MRPLDLTWVGGEHSFALGLGNLRAIQQHCDAGPNEIYMRLTDGRWRIDDLFEVLRQGLIGGGMDNSAASKLITDMMSRHPLLEFTTTARAVLAVALVGPEDDKVGKPEGAETTPPENGDSQRSTETEP